MRYVDRSKLVKPTGWNQRAQTASQAVANGADPNDHGVVWRELKDGLASLLHDKCWYCETHVDRSDNAVDHFRPKNCVSDAANPTLATVGWPLTKVTFAMPVPTAIAGAKIRREAPRAARPIVFLWSMKPSVFTRPGQWRRSSQCCLTLVKYPTGAYSAVIKRMVNHARPVLILPPGGGLKSPSRSITCTTSRHASDATQRQFS